MIAEDSAISPNNELQDPSLGNAFARQVLQYCEDNKLPTDNIFLYAMQERPSKLNLDLFLSNSFSKILAHPEHISEEMKIAESELHEEPVDIVESESDFFALESEELNKKLV